MAGLVINTLQTSYDAAPGNPQILLSAGNPFGAQSVGFVEDGSNPVQIYRNNAGAVMLATAFDGTRTVISSGVLETDIGLNQRASIRIVLDGIELMPQDRTFTVLPTTARINFQSTLTLDHANASFQAFIGLVGTVLNAQNGSLFGNGLLFNHANTYGNVNGIAANLGPIFTIVDQATYRADNAAITMPQQNTIRVQPEFSTINGGTLDVFSAFAHQQILMLVSYEAGVTVGAAGREAIAVDAATGAGTMTGPETGIRIANFTLGSGTRRGAWIEMNSPGRSLDLSGSGSIHLGDASATIGLHGTAPVSKATITGSRAGNAALTSLLSALAARGDFVDSTTA